jgi:hypothetical protein
MESLPIIPLGSGRWMQVIMNLIPLLGVIFYDWSVFALIYAFWLETLGLSFINALQILFAQKSEQKGPFIGKALRFMVVRIFILLFYLLFMIVFVGLQISDKQEDVVHFAMYLLLIQPTFRLTIGVFFAIKLIEFVYYYFIKNQRGHTSPNDFSALLEGRIIVIHVVIVLGVFASQFFSEKLGNHSGVIAFATVFVLVKMLGDYVSMRIGKIKIPEKND